ncbi:MAG: CHASE2 domain-containing protein [Bryobacteraceae bacterium]|nr:CHASE2 domain-containing protein [Bryobacteraceae bacterium]
MKPTMHRRVGYVLVLTAAFLLGWLISFTRLPATIDNAAYDWMFNLHQPAYPPAQSALLTIDEASLTSTGGRRNLRRTLARALDLVSAAKPKAIAIDLILAEPGEGDDELRAALTRVPNLVLGADIPQQGGWEWPIFRAQARAIGHVHADPDPVSRHLPLMKLQQTDRLWAICLETYRLAAQATSVLETPTDLEVGPRVIPARPDTRDLLIRYRRPGQIPRLSVRDVIESPARASLFTGKAVFVGFTAQSEVKDRLMTPMEVMMPGVEIHAHAYETIAAGDFLTEARPWVSTAACLALAVLAGLIFWRMPGWLAYAAAGVLLLAAHLLPHLLFRQGIVFPTFAPLLVAWLSVASAAAYQYFGTKRELARTEQERSRYQQAIHFVTHEMRTPLTAIQGSSELMSRYNLNPDKQKQMAQMINAESKRLARMITTFLNLERLGDGSLDLKREAFSLAEALGACVDRARAVAERKQMTIEVSRADDAPLTGDRELLEYAIYNLLTNAVKYSPAESIVTVTSERTGDKLRLSVADQGMGMDAQELKHIFDKFYRTKRAEAAGIEGTGIGLSIVQEIVRHHGGRIEVASQPGQGSCFTLILPATT